MKQILCTHTDLDGAGCSILFKQCKPGIEVQYHDYDTIDQIATELWENKDKYDNIYFADITPSPEIGIPMLDDPKFTLIDHHITREYLHHTPWFATHVCATSISKLFLRYQANQEFIRAVDAYDMWKLDSEYRELGVELNTLFDYYGMDEFVDRFSAMHLPTQDERNIIDVLKYIDNKYITHKIEQGKIKVDEYNNTYFNVYVDQKKGNLGAILQHPDFPPECQYVQCIFINDNEISLYSNKIDVSPICKARGGGGHAGACGYQCGR